MPLCLTPRIEAITREITGRPVGLFEEDLAARRHQIKEAVTGRRMLVAGGAGSIGSATIMELLRFEPAALTVLDTSENNLAELIRAIRSREQAFQGELKFEPLDYGSPLARHFLASLPQQDVVLSFAALKHVRSERDAFSLLRMLEVNLVKAHHFLCALRALGHGGSGVFFVSTDKAAHPVSLMGASKRAMEMLLWAHTHADFPGVLGVKAGAKLPPLPRMTTTRFANVAFSDGSLPWGFLQRLEKRQPLAGPSDVRRYLVSPQEAGQLCVLASLACPHKHLLVPRLSPENDLVDFGSVADVVLRSFGFEPVPYHDEAAAKASVEREAAARRYPVVLTPSATSGEKEIEEFVAPGETPEEVDLRSAQAISACSFDPAALEELLGFVAHYCNGAERLPGKGDFVATLGKLIPDFEHIEKGASLDEKM
ncbi:MAG: polysaccharide biosynthesis protein [Planctomycetota bacterium]|nr:polysaccharide biosynthesis protein [Planctomycetota bacterium]